MIQTNLEIHDMLKLIKTADLVLQFEIKESFKLRIHNGKESTLLLWSVISFGEARIGEMFFARRADHGSTMKLLYEVSS